MMRASFLLTAIALLASCSSINLKTRKGEDISLNDSNFSLLSGTYSKHVDHFQANSILRSFSRIQIDTSSFKNKKFRIEIEPIDLTRLKINFYSNDSLITRSTTRGKFKKGYFNVKRKWVCKAAVGPLLWALGNESTFIGLTNKKDLVMLSSRNGVGFIIAIPGFASGGQDSEIFERD